MVRRADLVHSPWAAAASYFRARAIEKSPNAATDGRWQFVFPAAARICRDPRRALTAAAPDGGRGASERIRNTVVAAAGEPQALVRPPRPVRPPGANPREETSVASTMACGCGDGEPVGSPIAHYGSEAIMGRKPSSLLCLAVLVCIPATLLIGGLSGCGETPRYDGQWKGTTSQWDTALMAVLD